MSFLDQNFVSGLICTVKCKTRKSRYR